MCDCGTSILSWMVRLLVRPLIPNTRPGDADVIVVLGAPLLPDGSLGPSCEERVQAGVGAWHEGRAPWILFTGGRTDPSPWADVRAAFFGIAARERSPVAEAEAMRVRALALGVPEAAILVEDRARSTAENARFTAEMMRARGLERALVVTQPYHLRRSLTLLRWEGLEAIGLEIEDSRIFAGGWDSARSLRWVTREYLLLGGERLLRATRDSWRPVRLI